MKNKFKKEEWENNIKFYKNLFSTNSFDEFREMVGDTKGTVDHFDGPKSKLKQGEYNMRKSSGEHQKTQRIDLKEFSDINTIKRNIITKDWNKADLETISDKDEMYDSVEFNNSRKSGNSNMFDTSSSIDHYSNQMENPVSLETSLENDNIRQIIEKCIMEGDPKPTDSRPMSLKSEDEIDDSNYEDPFGQKLKSMIKEQEQKEEGGVKTSFVKFRDVKYIQSYDFETLGSDVVWNPLKESKAPESSSQTKGQAFSLQRICFDKIENKLIYAMTEAFRSNSKDIVDTELLELIQGIFQTPGDENIVINFFKKGKQELEVSQRYLWKFHIVCKNFLSLEKEGLIRRQNRFIKALGDFAVR